MELKWKLYSTHYNYKEKGSIYNINFRGGKENHPKKKEPSAVFRFLLLLIKCGKKTPENLQKYRENRKFKYIRSVEHKECESSDKGREENDHLGWFPKHYYCCCSQILK